MLASYSVYKLHLRTFKRLRSSVTDDTEVRSYPHEMLSLSRELLLACRLGAKFYTMLKDIFSYVASFEETAPTAFPNQHPVQTFQNKSTQLIAILMNSGCVKTHFISVCILKVRYIFRCDVWFDK